MFGMWNRGSDRDSVIILGEFFDFQLSKFILQINSDCPRTKACVQHKCIDPCPGVCGRNAKCEVINHVPSCSCIEGYIGNAFVECRLPPPPPPVPTSPPVRRDPCQPNPCGPNSICRAINEQAICSCLPEYFGSPPNCRPECVVNSDCPLDKACRNLRCEDPCPGTCAWNANCKVINHSPICSCKVGFTGDPFSGCQAIPPPPPERIEERDPCVPSPCGPNSICTTVNGRAQCSCKSTFIGPPPNCRVLSVTYFCRFINCVLSVTTTTQNAFDYSPSAPILLNVLTIYHVSTISVSILVQVNAKS
jgi:hypothetical protein